MRSVRVGTRISKRKRLTVNTRKLGLQIVLLLATMAAFGYFLLMMRQRQGTRGPYPRHVPPYYESVERAKPLPQIVAPGESVDRKLVRAYEIARRIPEILVQQPSYCTRESGLHHRSLLHCFSQVDSALCDACIKQAYLADSLFRAGKTAAEIRLAMIAGDWQRIDLKDPVR